MQLLNEDGRLWRDLQDALVKAFPAQANLRQMVRFGLNENLDAIAGGDTLSDVVFSLIQWSEAQARTDELLVAARNQNPGNPKLRAFAERVQLAPAPAEAYPPGGLEQIVIKSVQFANAEQWRERMSSCEVTVCRVEAPDETYGTGFLLGPDLVMTNHHVVKQVIPNPGLRENVVLRFDYKTGPDGVELRPSQTYRLAADWLVDSSPSMDLDYALMRVEGTPGEDPVGGQQGAPQRGWLKPAAHAFEVGEPILILQHPQAAPLKFTPGSLKSVIAGGQRVTYTANTLPGSSGSPCFTAGWDLVALHHYGDPTGNEGIVFSAIVARPKVKTALQL
jgi:hypothetical protein